MVGNQEGSTDIGPHRRHGASARMHSLATIPSKLPNNKAKSENLSLGDTQNSDVAQIRNTDDAH
jgi:hypothetical protein